MLPAIPQARQVLHSPPSAPGTPGPASITETVRGFQSTEERDEDEDEVLTITPVLPLRDRMASKPRRAALPSHPPM